ncbi:MAG: phosphoadenylyl-sulfate reductase [Nitrospinota bacterium]
MPAIEKKELTSLQETLEPMEAEEVLSFAVKKYGKGLSLASSFGAEDMVLVQMLSTIQPGGRVFLLDTDYLFKETEDLIQKSKERFDLTFEVCSPALSIAEMEKQYGADLFRTKPDLCCKLRKIEPLRKHLKGLDAWITGIRRDQTPMREKAKKIEYDDIFGLIKFNPIADWSSKRVWEYIETNNVPYNPLHDQGFPSIGCKPCTRKVEKGDDPRAGRWTGNEKTECGLHFDSEGKVVSAKR